MIASMAVPHWSPARADEHGRPEPAPPDPRPDHTRPDPRPDHTRPDHGRTEDALVAPRHLDRENAALRELVTVYRYLSGLALQDADLAGVVRLISDRMTATVAVVTQLMDVLTAAAPGVTAEQAAVAVREHVVHPRLGQVLRASRLSQRALRL